MTPVLGYEVVNTFPHDESAYTQGLVIVDGQLYESTGQLGESGVRRVDLATGAVELEHKADSRHFCEGLAAYRGQLFQLTWKSHTVFVYDREPLQRQQDTFSYPGEGWGLTTTPDGSRLVMSDGTDMLRFVDPKGFVAKRRVRVTDRGQPVMFLNELEWIEDEIWANVWKSDRIARIDPKTGVVNAWVDLTGIMDDGIPRDPEDEVLNGIAYDKDTKAIYVTGKRWPSLFEIRVK